MINDKNKNTWCVNAFHGLRGANDGSTMPCCMYKPDHIDDPMLLGRESLDEHFNHPLLQKLRDDLNNGIRNKNCQYCWSEEDAGRDSKRIRDNNKFSKLIEPTTGIAYLELNLGNNCNLSCRTCTAEVSSGWMKETYDTTNTGKTYKQFALEYKKFHQSYDDESLFWPELIGKLSNIREIHFYGGEPFMNKKMWETLKTAEETGVAKDISLHYNTNGTHFPRKDLDSWKSFKEVNISFSVDGIGARFEYMRYPAKWIEVTTNIQRITDLNREFKNLSFSMCVTISVANIYYLPEIIDYYHQHFRPLGIGLYLNLVHGPTHYNVGILPVEIKKIITDRLLSIPKNKHYAWIYLPGIINFMNNSISNAEELNKFFQVTRTSDDYRKQNFQNTFKEYARLF